MYNKITELKQSLAENPRPVLLEFKTFRMRGHETSGTKYVPQELMDEWATKDPVQNFKDYLLRVSVLTEEEDAQIKAEIKQEIDENYQTASNEPAIEANLETELNDVYAPFDFQGS